MMKSGWEEGPQLKAAWSIAINRRTVSAQLAACKEWPTHKFPDVQLSIEFSQDSRSAEPPSIILKQELAGLKLKLLALI